MRSQSRKSITQLKFPIGYSLLKTKKGYTIPINEKYPNFLADGDGNKLTGSSARTMLQCVDPFDPEYLGNESLLDNIEVSYDCNNGVTLTMNWKISTSVNLLTANPNNPSQLSRGRIRFRNTLTNTYYYTNLTITPIVLGTPYTDPNNPNKQIYDLSYTVTVPTSDWNTPKTIEHWIIIYTDCDLDLTISTGWIGSFTPTVSYTDICNKIDKIQIFANGSGGLAYFNGCDAAVQTGPSCYPDVSQRPHEHEVEWKKAGDITFGAFQPVNFPNAYGCSPARSVLPSVLTLPVTFPVTGNLTFKYRNVKRSSSNGCTSSVICYGPWSDEIVINIP